MTTPDPTNRDARARAITLLLAAAETGSEINALIRVALRAGFMWRCPTCRENHYADRETCCGKPRPDDA
ncbi:hypothetical protein [Streptomyces shenzhenensis]|uniref:Uncharacterized protein n=1 Tax=Streptomyces shenzhenensis TaxID=943815 RepID=A0A3M0I9W1_9ACTN|nr:hypothetical protein [Streptomyces shenzhenensis]RMB85604.1 hypothetical protein CTZ28_12490 [Streptomyces shenzhenensis]